MMRSRRMGPTARTMILCAMGLASGLTMTSVLIVSVRGADSAARELGDRALPAQVALREASRASNTGQQLLEATVQTRDPGARAIALGAAQAALQRQDAGWAVYLQHALDRPGEHALQQAYKAAAARSVALAASLLGTGAADPAYATTFASERHASEAAASALASLQTNVYDPIVRARATAIVSGINDTRKAAYVSYSGLALVFSAIGVWLMQGARRDNRRMTDDAKEMKTEARYSSLETSLQRALEMEHSEEATFDIIAQALTIEGSDVPAEMLLADSSRAHFRQVFSTAPDADAACRVSAPADCPATMSGQTQFFRNSSELDTCPSLRGRNDAVWATCVPINIAGRATGVLHVQRSVDFPPADTCRGWELIARKAGDRLGMLRAFARSETQARTDPLTGLLNRRSLDARSRDLTDEGLPYVVAYGDLDQFKLLNDVHGHDTGDRALRLFARVLRDNVRPNDIPARYGGEEFVALLPDCTIDNAIIVVERIRTQLHSQLAEGSVPSFTVSFGLAASDPGLTFGEVIEAADQALLRAKREGRDRIIVAATEPTADAGITRSGPLRAI